MSHLALTSYWFLFFATATFGHVGMKLAVMQPEHSFLGALHSAWGIAALVSWTASALIWAWLLSFQPLLNASSVAVLRYVFLVLAAHVLFKESINVQILVGAGLIASGICVVASEVR